MVHLTDSLYSQILSLGEQIAFNRNCEAAIRNRTLPKFLQELEMKLKSYTTVQIPVDELGETGTFASSISLCTQQYSITFRKKTELQSVHI